MEAEPLALCLLYVLPVHVENDIACLKSMQNLNCRLHFSVKYTLQELTIAHLWLSLSCVCKKILSFSFLLMFCCLLLHGLSRLAPGIGLNHSTLSSLLDLKSTISRLRFVCTRCWELTQHSMQTFQCEHCLKIEDNLPELDDLFSLQFSFCIFWGDEV